MSWWLWLLLCVWLVHWGWFMHEMLPKLRQAKRFMNHWRGVGAIVRDVSTALMFVVCSFPISAWLVLCLPGRVVRWLRDCWR